MNKFECGQYVTTSSKQKEVILVTDHPSRAVHGYGTFSGVVVSADDAARIGRFSDAWYVEAFVLCDKDGNVIAPKTEFKVGQYYISNSGLLVMCTEGRRTAAGFFSGVVIDPRHCTDWSAGATDDTFICDNFQLCDRDGKLI